MFPFLRSKNNTALYNISTFGGLNKNHRHDIGELTECLNTSSENYPVLCTSKAPSSERTFSNTALTAGYFNKLYTIEYSGEESGNIYLCHNAAQTPIGEYSTAEEVQKPRKLAFIKNQILAIPDNVIYNTNSDTAKPGCVSQSMSESLAQAKFEKESQTDDDMPMVYNTWYSGYLSGNSIISFHKGYRPSSTTYQFYNFSLGEDFETGDIVTVKMTVKPIDEERDDAFKAYVKKMANGVTLKIKNLVKTTHSTPSGSITEYTEVEFEDGTLDHGGYNEVFVLNITVEKGIPNFVDICSSGNRMWGVTADSIHASKLGNCSMWQDFTADSYGVLPSSSFETGVESDGNFTAITSYNGNIIAFKEDCIYKIYGNEPREFTLSRKDFPGVCEGGADTLVNVSGTLYYRGKDGIYAYSGSVPRLISKNILTKDSVCTHASGDDRFYYVIAASEGKEGMYVYDTLCKVWHFRESCAGTVKLVNTSEGVKCITSKEIFDINATPPKEWYFTFGLGDEEFSDKHICSVYFRYCLGEGARFELYLINEHKTYRLATGNQKIENGVMKLRLPVSCSKNHTLKFSGEGYFSLNAMEIGFRETGIYK